MAASTKELVDQAEEDALWKDAAVVATLGISRVKLWELDRAGILTAVRIGRSVRWRKSDVMAFIRNLGK